VNLIKAADQSTVTRRFIPSVWSGFNYTRESVLPAFKHARH
jgi:hypothetical protein